jgi:hypothetical protein
LVSLLHQVWNFTYSIIGRYWYPYLAYHSSTVLSEPDWNQQNWLVQPVSESYQSGSGFRIGNGWFCMESALNCRNSRFPSGSYVYS